jgi:methylmalonyl-CoA mutase N-terminal domain/subunit
MFDQEPLDEIRRARQRWEAEAGRAAAVRGAEPHECQHDPDLTVRPVYTPAEVADQDVDYLRDLGFPGQYPFTRGIYPAMYRARGSRGTGSPAVPRTTSSRSSSRAAPTSSRPGPRSAWSRT